jgi:hypothetical protein
MNKETIKKLTKPFPKSVVQKAPQGKYGDYVPHHIYTQRLVDVVGGEYNFRIKEIIRDKDNAVVGAICRLEINGLGVVEEVGDVDAHAIKRNITESEVLKLAVSDGIKRCCMRFGIGLELWTGGVSEEEHYAGETPKEVVVKEEPKKKLIAQEEQTSPSSITEPQIKEMVFTMCNEDKQFAKKCYETTMTRIKMDKNVSDNVGDWSNDTVDKFLKLVESYVDKYKDDFKERANNSEVINNTLDILDAKIVEKKEQEDMADIPEGKWMEDPISDGQKNFINSLIEQCIDAGLDELGAEGKSYLNGGSATKGNASAMIDKLKSALS